MGEWLIALNAYSNQSGCEIMARVMRIWFLVNEPFTRRPSGHDQLIDGGRGGAGSPREGRVLRRAKNALDHPLCTPDHSHSPKFTST